MPLYPCILGPGRRRQSGVSLVSSLVAVAALALSVVGATRAQSQVRASIESARQRIEATQLAQDEIERIRAFPSLEAGSDDRGHDALAIGRREARSVSGGTVYALARTVTTDEASRQPTVQVEVSWRDRADATRRVRIATLVGRLDPALGGALTQPARGRPLGRVHGRDARIPLAAHDLGDGRSLLKLSAAGTHAVLIDNASGAVTAVCSVDPGRSTDALDRADLGSCAPAPGGLLVTGRVRFSLGAAPSALAADDTPLAFDVVLAATSTMSGAPLCGTAPKASGRERWVDYTCLVVPAPGAEGWSGRVELAPAGWAIGTRTGRYRVCRHSADHDASGAVDRAFEHAARQSAVTTSLAEQNFLVVAGPEACPGGAPVEVDGRGTENRADFSTVQHQP